MKNYWLSILAALSLLTACKEYPIPLPDGKIGLVGDDDINGILRSIQLRGHFFEEEMPQPDTAKTRYYKTTADSDTIQVSPGMPLYLLFTIPKLPPGLRICGTHLSLVGATGHWNIAIDSVASGGGQQALRIIFPTLVRQSGQLSFIFNSRVCGQKGDSTFSYVTDFDTTVVNFSAPLECGKDTISGRSKTLFFRRMTMNDKKGKVIVRFKTTEKAGDLPDRLDIKLGNRYVLSSGTLFPHEKFPTCQTTGGGTVGFVSTNGWREYNFQYDPNFSRDLTIQVVGNCAGGSDGWKLFVKCAE